MPRFPAAEAPDAVTVKPEKPPAPGQPWSSRARVALCVLAVAVYLYLVLFLKTAYQKNQRLDRIAEMASETERLLHKLHTLDETLALELNQLHNNLDY